MTITKKTAHCPKGEITIYCISNSTNAIVELSSLGAGITKIIVPDSNGKLDDVVLGYPDYADYMYDSPCAGKTPGRFANRIAKGKFSIDNVEYQLDINNAPNALHGGVNGFHNCIWDSHETNSGVVFTYYSKDGEEGYPGNITVSVEYNWNDNNELTIEYKAKTDIRTIVNLTNHTYFNLSGKDRCSCLDHELKLNSSQWIPTDNTDIPLGYIASVCNTPMDFRTYKMLGKDIHCDFSNLIIGKGYNHFFLIDEWKNDGKLREVAMLRDSKSGRLLKVETTQRGAMLYSGNWLDDSPKGKSGEHYHDYDGVAIECQEVPDAPNLSCIPFQYLDKDEEYHHIIKFAFITE